jgi:ribonuclease inhibitor
MKEVRIDGSKYDNIREIHKLIGKEFDWPYYGHNLDALWDVLTTEEKPFTIRWINVEESKRRIGKDCTSMLDILKEIADKDSEKLPKDKRFIFIME